MKAALCAASVVPILVLTLALFEVNKLVRKVNKLEASIGAIERAREVEINNIVTEKVPPAPDFQDNLEQPNELENNTAVSSKSKEDNNWLLRRVSEVKREYSHEPKNNAVSSKFKEDDNWLLRRVTEVKLEAEQRLVYGTMSDSVDAYYGDHSGRHGAKPLDLEELPRVAVISIDTGLACRFFTEEFPRLKRWHKQGDGLRLAVLVSSGDASSGSPLRFKFLYGLHYGGQCPELVLDALKSCVVYRWFVTHHGPIDQEIRGLLWVQHPKLEYIPIGFSRTVGDSWATLKSEISSALLTKSALRNNQLFVSMDVGKHADRRNALYWININFGDVPNTYVSSAKHFRGTKETHAEMLKVLITYARNLTQARFVVSPPGFGIDCNRHYEALLGGAVPIVNWSPLMEQIFQDLPVILVRSWAELTPSVLEESWVRLADNADSFQLEKLSRTYWENRVALAKRTGLAVVSRLHAKNLTARKCFFYSMDGASHTPKTYFR